MQNVNPSPFPPLLLNRQEAARAIGICARTLDAMIRRREVPHVHIGRRVLIALSDLEAYVESIKIDANRAAA